MQIIASYIQLIFIYNSTNFLTLPDFPDRVEILPLLVGGNSKVTNQYMWFFMNTPENFTSFLRGTCNSICSWKNVMTFYFYPYPPFRNIKIFMKILCLSFSFHDMKIDSFSNASVLNSLYQKQLFRGVLREMFSENMHAANFIYRRTPIPKCNLLNSHFDMDFLL